MGRFVLRRLLQGIPTLFGVTLLSFALWRFSPGDPVSRLVFGVQDVTPEEIAALRHLYGLDQSLPQQYLSWLGRLLRLDFGQSFLYHRPVTEMLASALPNTVQLAAFALILALGIGIPLGVIAARRRGSLVDQLVRVFGVAGHAIPSFWFGYLFIFIFAVQFRLFPVGGMLTIGHSDFDVADKLRHVVGPGVALALAGIANYSRLMRTETLDVLSQDFIRAAQAKGLHQRTVLFVHALRNALLPIITALGALLAVLVSGSLVIEQVFAWPGMGRMIFEAAVSKDYPIVMAAVVISGFLLVISYIARDIAYGIADPRVRR